MQRFVSLGYTSEKMLPFVPCKLACREVDRGFTVKVA